MTALEIAERVQPLYRRIQWTALLAMGLLMVVGFLSGKFFPFQGQMIFCLFGVGTGAAVARMFHPAGRELTWLAAAALLAVTASQVFYQLLVWSETWRVHPSVIGWRLWWSSVVGTICLGLLQVLWRAGARWKWNSGRTTLGFTALLGALLIWLAFRSNPVATFPGWWLILTPLAALGSFVGSTVLITRWGRSRPDSPTPMAQWFRTALSVTAQVVVVAGAFYVGRLSVPPPSPFDHMPSALAEMSTEEVQRQVELDHRALREVVHSLDALGDEAEQWHATVQKTMRDENRGIYNPAETDALRDLFGRFLRYRGRLTRMVALYLGFREVRDDALRARAYLLGYCAGATLLESGRRLVKEFRDDPLARAKLNEADPGRLKPDMFEAVYHGVTSPEHMEMFATLGRLYRDHQQRWREEEVFKQADFDWLAGRIESSTSSIADIRLSPTRAWFSRIKRRMLRDANMPLYEAQEIMSTIVGDTRMVSRPAFISEAQIVTAKGMLEPGDILLVRRNWYLSNAFLPGFWPHAALYVGTPEQLKALGIDESNAGPAWEDYMTPEDGRQRVVLEAVSEGVGFYAAEHSMGADYVLAMRPKLAPEQIRQAILKAFEYNSRDYDFNFDFFTDDKIVCSELIYRAYHPMLTMDNETVLGKTVITPLGLGRKCTREHGQPGGQLEFVLFLDTAAGQSSAHFARMQNCAPSMDRPKAFNE